MRRQIITTTALPNGVVGGRLRLSAFIAPRLWTDDPADRQLARWPDWIDWPGTALAFRVVLGPHGPLPATRVGPPPRSDLWQALFPPTSPVLPYAFRRFDNRRIRSYPVRHVMRFIREQWRTVAVSTPGSFPAAGALLGANRFGGVDFHSRAGADRAKALEGQLEGLLTAHKAVPPGQSADADLSFYQLQRFHTPASTKRVTLSRPELDFHRVLGALLPYPRLLRELGLVHDLEVDLAAVPGGSPPAAATVAVLLGITGAEAPSASFERRDLACRTHYTYAGTTFHATSDDADLAGGMLRLNDQDAFEVVQVDVDGAAMKAIGFAGNLVRAQQGAGKTQDTPERYALPSLRSAGISVARHGRAARQVSRFARVFQHHQLIEGGSAPILYAQDVVRGYAIDVWDSVTGRWHQLTARQSRYEFPRDGLVVEQPDAEHPEPEETGITMSLTETADDPPAGAPPPDVNLTESLFRWDGWSLAVRRPGAAVDGSGQPDRNDPVLDTAFQLKTGFRVPAGSLPALRFGRQYYLRARALDLAGNGVPFDPAGDFSKAAGPVKYHRFEPVSPPAVLLRKPLTTGESVDRLVLRSNYDRPPATTTQRHIVPPLTAQQMAEQHGLFDVPGGMNKDLYDVLVSRDGDLSGNGVPGAGADPNHQNVPYFDADTLSFPSPVTGQNMVLPYLPDPLSRGVALRVQPGTSQDSTWQAWTLHVQPYTVAGAWYDARPYRIELFEQDQPSAPTYVNGALRIGLPKAEVVRVRLSSVLNASDLNVMGAWSWVVESNPPDLAQLQATASTGGHWMLTPFREITLVHAVQQPLVPTQWNNPTVDRALGQTFIRLRDQVQVHGNSTSKWNVRATWTEWVDVPGAGELDGPKQIQGEAEVFEYTLEPGQSSALVSGRHELGDTKHRVVQYHARASTRFWDYYQHPSGDTTPYWRDTSDAGGSGPKTRAIPNAARPAAPTVLYVLPTFGWDSGSGATTKFSTRRGGGLRVYLDRPWFSSGDGELLGVVHLTNATSELPNDLKPYVTQWGLDPVYGSSALPASVPTAQQFLNPSHAGSGLTLAELPSDRTVSVAGYQPQYDWERKLWYCDLQVNIGGAYWPFVRLALARYQPSSLPGAHLSRVVLADFVQLAPDRSATISYSPGGLKVTVSVAGPAYSRTVAGDGPSLMRVAVQVRDPHVPGDLGWKNQGNEVLLTGQDVAGPNAQWTGTVSLPGAIGSQSFRLVVREYERLHSGTTTTYPPVALRLSYLDAFVLPGPEVSRGADRVAPAALSAERDGVTGRR